MIPLEYIVEERPMEKPKDVLYYAQMLTKNPSGEWETSEQQFLRELSEGKWAFIGCRKSYQVWTNGFSRRRLGGPVPKRDIRRVTGGWYREYYDGHHIYYTRDCITKESYTASEWANMCSWNPDLKKY